MFREDITWSLNGKDYVLQIDDNLINAFIKENGKLIPVSSEDDKRLVSFVLDNLVPDLKDSIRVSEISLGEEIYEVFLDKKRAMYFFYEKDDNKLSLPKQEVLDVLNLLYNDHKIEAYLEEDKDEWALRAERDWNNRNLELEEELRANKPVPKKKPKFYTRFVRIGSGFLAINIALGLVIPKDKRWKFEYALREPYSYSDNISKTEFSKEGIVSAIANNPNFTAEEKEFLSNLGDVLEENKDYIDYDEVVKNLSEMYFVDKRNIFSDSTVATYTFAGSFKNMITRYGTYYEVSEKVQQLTDLHEVGHGLTNHSEASALPTPIGETISGIESMSAFNIPILNEIVNELFAREYYHYLTYKPGTSTGYESYMPALYGLCEIIDSEVIREFKFQSDARILVKALREIDGDEDRAYGFLTLFNTLSAYKEIISKYASLFDILYDSKLTKENYLDLMYRKVFDAYLAIGDEIKYYYEAKFDRKIDTDLMMGAILYRTPYIKSDDSLNELIDNTYGKGTNVLSIEFKPRHYLAKHGHKEASIEVTKKSEPSYDDGTLTFAPGAKSVSLYIINNENRYGEEAVSFGHPTFK